MAEENTAQEYTGAGAIGCPLKNPALCKLDVSLELTGERGILQANCTHCGHGRAITLPTAAAMELHDEMHRHRATANTGETAGTPAGIPVAPEQAAGGETEPAASDARPPE